MPLPLPLLSLIGAPCETVRARAPRGPPSVHPPSSFLPAAAGLHLAIFFILIFSGRVSLEGISIFCQRV